MCIGNFCAYLTPEEQRAQHNFEERKGPYPRALAERLEAEGVMTRAEHLERSIVLINKNAVHGFSWGDRSPEEKAYIQGMLHIIPKDAYLTPENQSRIHKLARRERHSHFCQVAGKEETTIQFLVAYPECGQWMSELLGCKAFSTAALARKLAVVPALLGPLAPTMHEKSLARLAFDLAAMCGLDPRVQQSGDPTLEVLTVLANQVSAVRTDRCNVRAELENIRLLNIRAAGAFSGDRQQQRRERRKVRKLFCNKLNMLRHEFYKLPVAMELMAWVVRELKAPSGQYLQAA